MDLLQLIILSIVQGITEFLPVSSSAHLILVPVLTDWDDQGLMFDVAAHLGTLLAVVIYYRHDLLAMTQGMVRDARTKRMGEDSRLALYIVLATIPLGLCGLICKDLIEEYLRSPLVIAGTTLIFGVMLAVADRMAAHQPKEMAQLTWRSVLIIGLAQMLALIPGTSRSGITITAALMAGFSRQAAAKFSFLLSIPAILMPCSLYVLEIMNTPSITFDVFSVAVIILLSFISAYLCIALFIKALDRIGMMPFVVYRLVLGVFLLVVFL